MSFEYTVRDDQTSFDIAIQHFGTLENYFDFLADNPTLTVDDIPAPLSVVKIDNTDKGVNDVKNDFEINSVFCVNPDSAEDFIPVIPGDFNNDYNNDFNIQT